MSKHNIKSVVEFTVEDQALELDSEYRKELMKETEEYHKESEYNNKCINICSDIRTYLDENAISNVIFKNLSVNNIKQLLFEIYS
jgi:hypothetical protein